MKVSISMLAYNQEPYIEQAVRSALAQRTTFDYEIVVGEDCSTDRTLEILQRLQEQYPDKIRLLPSERNLGMIENSIRSFLACDGEYIALLDGDDYWCAEDKLQQQVEFLDQHPDFSIVFHSVLRVDEDNSQQPKLVRPDRGQAVFELADLIRSNFIPTCSAVMRNGLIDEFPSWSYSLRMLDWLTFILAAKHGKIGFIDDVMAVYRIHSQGVWSSMGSINRLVASIDLFEKITPDLGDAYTKQIRSSLDKHWRKLMDELYDFAIIQGSQGAARDQINKISAALENLQSIPAGWRRELWERIYCYYLMTNFESQDYPAAWSAWLSLMKNDPSLLLNRGLFLIGMQSAFNGRWRAQIQRLTRSYRSKQNL